MHEIKIKNSAQQIPIGKIVCIGRNYAEHAKELGNELPAKPVLFLKPASAVIYSGDDIIHPAFGNDLHHEVELVLLIGNDVKNGSPEEAENAIAGYGVGLDMTLRDIGVFGGPGGEKYTYQDLAPKPPSNLTAVYDSGLVKLTWNRNTEADFYRYRVYRDTVSNFIYDTTKIIAEVADTFYYDDLPEKYIAGSYYYKLTAIDSAYHQSAASEEVHVMVTGAPEGPPIVIEEYKLLNNYPNPFNPNTKIPYRLKEGGYVKLMVYDIKGVRINNIAFGMNGF